MAATKELTVEKAVNKLQRKLNQMFTKAEQEDLEWYTDVVKKDSYTWRFRYKGTKMELVCNMRSGTITTVRN